MSEKESVSAVAFATSGGEAATEQGGWKIKRMMIFYMLVTHIGGLIGLVIVCLHQRGWQMALEVVVLHQIAALGITAGAHRLWAHRSYKAQWPLRFVLMILSSLSHQGSIYHWVRDHRIHHKFSETDADPHNAKRGIFFSHMGWLLLEKHPEVVKKGNELDLSDLEDDWVVRFQRKHYGWLSILCCYLLPGVYGYYVHNSYWIGLFTVGFLRHAMVLHATWFVNSIAHAFGMKPYDPAISPSENPFTALVTAGEGWHNWHHTYPFDYAASEYGMLGSFNPTKAFIDCFFWFGQVSDRRRATHLWQAKKARLAAQKVE